MLISTLLVLMVKIIKELALNINEGLWGDDVVAMALFYSAVCAG